MLLDINYSKFPRGVAVFPSGIAVHIFPSLLPGALQRAQAVLVCNQTKNEGELDCGPGP